MGHVRAIRVAAGQIRANSRIICSYPAPFSKPRIICSYAAPSQMQMTHAFNSRVFSIAMPISAYPSHHLQLQETGGWGTRPFGVRRPAGPERIGEGTPLFIATACRGVPLLRVGFKPARTRRHCLKPPSPGVCFPANSISYAISPASPCLTHSCQTHNLNPPRFIHFTLRAT